VSGKFLHVVDALSCACAADTAQSSQDDDMELATHHFLQHLPISEAKNEELCTAISTDKILQ